MLGLEKGIFSERPILNKFIILTAIVVFSTILLSIFAVLLMNPIFGIDALTNPQTLAIIDETNINALKLMQLFNTIGMFALPPFIFIYLSEKNTSKDYLYIDKFPNAISVIMATVLVLAMIPVINIMAKFNEAIHFPNFLSGVEQWMLESEEKAKIIVAQFLKINSPYDVVVNLIVVALVPAIGEELLFRGVIQKLMHTLTNNIHLSIFISAAIFSAIHFQFLGFFPRMFMGAVFGYLLYWSKNLWVPIIAHFVNNGLAVIVSASGGDTENFGNEGNFGLYAVLGTVVSATLLYFFYKFNTKSLSRSSGTSNDG